MDFIKFAIAGELLVVTTYNRYQTIPYTILRQVVVAACNRYPTIPWTILRQVN